MGKTKIGRRLDKAFLYEKSFMIFKKGMVIKMAIDALVRELMEEITQEDIADTYRPVVDIIGIEKFIELSDYARGDELYFPKPENITAPARNRRIKKEWNGYNLKELAEQYNLTMKQVGNILKDEPVIGQLSLFDGIQISGK